MGHLKVVVALLAILQQAPYIVATPIEERGASVCGSGIYGELVPILSPYPIAQAFCSAVFPVACTSAAKRKRSAPSTTAATTKGSTTTTKKAVSTTTSSVDSKASALSKCQRQPANVISTICSCIETPEVGYLRELMQNVKLTSAKAV